MRSINNKRQQLQQGRPRQQRQQRELPTTATTVDATPRRSNSSSSSSIVPSSERKRNQQRQVDIVVKNDNHVNNNFDENDEHVDESVENDDNDEEEQDDDIPEGLNSFHSRLIFSSVSDLSPTKKPRSDTNITTEEEENDDNDDSRSNDSDDDIDINIDLERDPTISNRMVTSSIIRNQVAQLEQYDHEINQILTNNHPHQNEEDGLQEEMFTLTYSQDRLRQELEVVDIICSPAMSPWSTTPIADDTYHHHRHHFNFEQITELLDQYSDRHEELDLQELRRTMVKGKDDSPSSSPSHEANFTLRDDEEEKDSERRRPLDDDIEESQRQGPPTVNYDYDQDSVGTSIGQTVSCDSSSGIYKEVVYQVSPREQEDDDVIDDDAESGSSYFVFPKSATMGSSYESSSSSHKQKRSSAENKSGDTASAPSSSSCPQVTPEREWTGRTTITGMENDAGLKQMVTEEEQWIMAQHCRTTALVSSPTTNNHGSTTPASSRHYQRRRPSLLSIDSSSPANAPLTQQDSPLLSMESTSYNGRGPMAALTCWNSARGSHRTNTNASRRHRRRTLFSPTDTTTIVSSNTPSQKQSPTQHTTTPSSSPSLEKGSHSIANSASLSPSNRTAKRFRTMRMMPNGCWDLKPQRERHDSPLNVNETTTLTTTTTTTAAPSPRHDRESIHGKCVEDLIGSDMESSSHSSCWHPSPPAAWISQNMIVVPASPPSESSNHTRGSSSSSTYRTHRAIFDFCACSAWTPHGVMTGGKQVVQDWFLDNATTTSDEDDSDTFGYMDDVEGGEGWLAELHRNRLPTISEGASTLATSKHSSQASSYSSIPSGLAMRPVVEMDIADEDDVDIFAGLEVVDSAKEEEHNFSNVPEYIPEVSPCVESQSGLKDEHAHHNESPQSSFIERQDDQVVSDQHSLQHLEVVEERNTASSNQAGEVTEEDMPEANHVVSDQHSLQHLQVVEERNTASSNQASGVTEDDMPEDDQVVSDQHSLQHLDVVEERNNASSNQASEVTEDDEPEYSGLVEKHSEAPGELPSLALHSSGKRKQKKKDKSRRCHDRNEESDSRPRKQVGPKGKTRTTQKAQDDELIGKVILSDSSKSVSSSLIKSTNDQDKIQNQKDTYYGSKVGTMIVAGTSEDLSSLGNDAEMEAFDTDGPLIEAEKDDTPDTPDSSSKFVSEGSMDTDLEDSIEEEYLEGQEAQDELDKMIRNLYEKVTSSQSSPEQGLILSGDKSADKVAPSIDPETQLEPQQTQNPEQSITFHRVLDFEVDSKYANDYGEIVAEGRSKDETISPLPSGSISGSEMEPIDTEMTLQALSPGAEAMSPVESLLREMQDQDDSLTAPSDERTYNRKAAGYDATGQPNQTGGYISNLSNILVSSSSSSKSSRTGSHSKHHMHPEESEAQQVRSEAAVVSDPAGGDGSCCSYTRESAPIGHQSTPHFYYQTKTPKISNLWDSTQIPGSSSNGSSLKKDDDSNMKKSKSKSSRTRLIRNHQSLTNTEEEGAESISAKLDRMLLASNSSVKSFVAQACQEEEVGNVASSYDGKSLSSLGDNHIIDLTGHNDECISKTTRQDVSRKIDSSHIAVSGLRQEQIDLSSGHGHPEKNIVIGKTSLKHSSMVASTSSTSTTASATTRSNSTKDSAPYLGDITTLSAMEFLEYHSTRQRTEEETPLDIGETNLESAILSMMKSLDSYYSQNSHQHIINRYSSDRDDDGSDLASVLVRLLIRSNLEPFQRMDAFAGIHESNPELANDFVEGTLYNIARRVIEQNQMFMKESHPERLPTSTRANIIRYHIDEEEDDAFIQNVGVCASIGQCMAWYGNWFVSSTNVQRQKANKDITAAATTTIPAGTSFDHPIRLC